MKDAIYAYLLHYRPSETLRQMAEAILIYNSELYSKGQKDYCKILAECSTVLWRQANAIDEVTRNRNIK